MWPAFEQAYAELAIQGAPAAEPEMRRELLFCLLGGHGVSYETSCSALRLVDKLDVFAPAHERETLRARLEGLLDEPRFEPTRKDGSLRRYRFPRRKTELICRARDWVLDAGALVEHLAARTCERDRRAWLVGCPGVGLKSASWLLRNTGWAHELAILDVHVMRAMTEAGIVLEEELPGNYERIEALFLQWCERLDAASAVFDFFLWEWQRGTLRPHATAP
jgi:N-glycosylase/DNA lyase